MAEAEMAEAETETSHMFFIVKDTFFPKTSIPDMYMWSH